MLTVRVAVRATNTAALHGQALREADEHQRLVLEQLDAELAQLRGLQVDRFTRTHAHRHIHVSIRTPARMQCVSVTSIHTTTHEYQCSSQSGSSRILTLSGARPGSAETAAPATAAVQS